LTLVHGVFPLFGPVWDVFGGYRSICIGQDAHALQCALFADESAVPVAACPVRLRRRCNRAPLRCGGKKFLQMGYFILTRRWAYSTVGRQRIPASALFHPGALACPHLRGPPICVRTPFPARACPTVPLVVGHVDVSPAASPGGAAPGATAHSAQARADGVAARGDAHGPREVLLRLVGAEH